MKYLAFDIEILKDLPEGEDWQEHRPLGITCAATLRTGDPAPVYWYSKIPFSDQPMSGAIEQLDLIDLVDYMREQMQMGFIPLTWNGLKFDFDVLAEESGLKKDCAWIAENHIDMMYHFLCRKGFGIGLAAANEGMGLSGKLKGMHGGLAPPMWRNDNEKLIEIGADQELIEMDAVEKRQHVLTYVGQDAQITLNMAEAVDKRGELSWITQRGYKKGVRLLEWKTVKEASELPFPDVSWMDAAGREMWSRDSFLAWMDGSN